MHGSASPSYFSICEAEPTTLQETEPTPPTPQESLGFHRFPSGVVAESDSAEARTHWFLLGTHDSDDSAATPLETDPTPPTPQESLGFHGFPSGVVAESDSAEARKNWFLLSNPPIPRRILTEEAVR